MQTIQWHVERNVLTVPPFYKIRCMKDAKMSLGD